MKALKLGMGTAVSGLSLLLPLGASRVGHALSEGWHRSGFHQILRHMITHPSTQKSVIRISHMLCRAPTLLLAPLFSPLSSSSLFLFMLSLGLQVYKFRSVYSPQQW